MKKIWLTFLILICCSVNVDAAVQLFDFSGYVEEVSQKFNDPGIIEDGEKFTGRFKYVYDSSILPEPNTTNVFQLVGTDLEVEFEKGFKIGVNPNGFTYFAPSGQTTGTANSFGLYTPVPDCDFFCDDLTFELSGNNIVNFDGHLTPSLIYPDNFTSGSLFFDVQQFNPEAFGFFVDGKIDKFGAAPVPEPATLILLSAGFLGFVCRYKKLGHTQEKI